MRYGRKPYGEIELKQRNAIQEQLIDDIIESELHGCAAVLNLEGWKCRRKQLDTLMGNDRKHNQPHLYAMRLCVMLMFHATEHTREPISFVFDQHKEAGGRTREWYRHMKQSDVLERDYRKRMGEFEEGSRLRVTGLQAADILAYSTFRHFSGKPSWQWEALRESKRLTLDVYEEKYWRALEEALNELQLPSPVQG
jgi:hypothetical protein